MNARAPLRGKHEYSVCVSDGATVKNGETEYALLLPEHPSEEILSAAEELLLFFEEATGIRLQWADGKQAPCISLGETAAGADVPFSAEEFGESGYRVVTAGKNYVLKGGKYGIRYAVYDLLKVFFGWETYSAKTVKCARGVTDLPFYRIDIAEIPDIPYRSPSHGWIARNKTLRDRFRMMRIRDAIDGEGSPFHNSFAYVPPEKHLADHPKWFSDDKKQLCYTAHGDREEFGALVEEAAGAVFAYIRKNPSLPYISFTHEDNFEWCGCPACKAVKERYAGANSASAILFLNAVRASVQRRFDDGAQELDRGQKLVFFAYHGTNAPPVRYSEEEDSFSLIDEEVRLRGIVPWFAETNADYTCALTEGETNAYVARNLRGWRKLTDEILFWTYDTNFFYYLAPYPSFEGQQTTYRFAVSQGIGLIYDECQRDANASTGWEELKGYLCSKLAWNTEADTEKLTEEFFAASYGRASGRMLNIYRQWRERGRKQIANGYCGWRSEFLDPIRRDWWEKEELLRWESEMTEAIRLTQEDENAALYRRNIVLERAAVRYLIAEVYEGDFTPKELEIRRREALDDLNECGVDMFAERIPLSELVARWSKGTKEN